MNIQLESPVLQDRKTLIISIIVGILVVLGIAIKAYSPSPSLVSQPKKLAIIQGNSLLPVSNPSGPLQPVQKIKMVITAYSSTTWQTDSTPLITASGASVKEGVVANNMLPFGTKIRIPEIYGDKIFVVEDRMSWKKGHYHLDIWFPEYWQAKYFGVKRAYIEILEN